MCLPVQCSAAAYMVNNHLVQVYVYMSPLPSQGVLWKNIYYMFTVAYCLLPSLACIFKIRQPIMHVSPIHNISSIIACIAPLAR